MISRPGSRTIIRRVLTSFGLLVFGTLLFLGWQHYYPVQSADGWSFQVYRDHIPMVSAMVVDQQGDLYVSQEFRNEQGVVLRLPVRGAGQDIMTKLSKPDGLVAFRDGIVAGQESGKRPVLWWREGKAEALFEGNSIEGLASDGRNLFAIEDVKRGGRLLEYDPERNETTTLRDDLEEGEGVAVCPDGELVYTEKPKGWIKRFVPGGNDEIIASGLNAPSFLMCNSAGLWITEDLTHRARLLLLDATGSVRTILSHLRSPQTIIAITPTRFLLAEQGRGRILELAHATNAKR